MYERIPTDALISQGDVIDDCPIFGLDVSGDKIDIDTPSIKVEGEGRRSHTGMRPSTEKGLECASCRDLSGSRISSGGRSQGIGDTRPHTSRTGLWLVFSTGRP